MSPRSDERVGLPVLGEPDGRGGVQGARGCVDVDGEEGGAGRNRQGHLGRGGREPARAAVRLEAVLAADVRQRGAAVRRIAGADDVLEAVVEDGSRGNDRKIQRNGQRRESELPVAGPHFEHGYLVQQHIDRLQDFNSDSQSHSIA